MARFVFGLILVVLVFLQATIVPGINPLIVAPNLVLVTLFIWSSMRGTREGLLWAFGAGLLLDGLSLDPLGTNGLALLLVVLLAGPARRRVFHSGMIIPIVLILLATLAHAAVLDIVRGTPPDRWLAVQAVLHAALVPPVYLCVGAMDRWVLQSTKR